MDSDWESQCGDNNMMMRPPQENSMRPPQPQEQEESTQTQGSKNSKKPLMKFVKKITQNKRKNSGGCEEWECILCGHVFKGSYTRV